jgi:hypothetical protein
MKEYVVIASTIFPAPSPNPEVVKSVYSSGERLEQTKGAVNSLIDLGYEDLLLLDNSGSRFQQILAEEFPAATVKTFDHFQYDNKGIAETILLLAGLEFVPDDRVLMKISGRYMLHRRVVCDLAAYDLAARVYAHPDRLIRHRKTMATRCYFVKNKRIYREYLLGLLQEIYGYSARIVGLGSLKRWLVNQVNSKANTYSYFCPSLSVEAASLRVVRKLDFRLQCLDRIGLTGHAGTFDSLLIED